MNARKVRALTRLSNQMSSQHAGSVDEITRNVVQKILKPKGGYPAQQQVMVGPKKLYKMLKKSLRQIDSGNSNEARAFFWNRLIKPFSNSNPDTMRLVRSSPCDDIVHIMIGRLYFAGKMS